MDGTTELLAYELRASHPTHPSHDRDTLARSALMASRRQRHRRHLAGRLRSIADRLDS